MKSKVGEQEIDEILSRGVEEVIDIRDLKEKLLSGKTLRIKLGIDPTSPNLHLGRSVPLLKLRDFQKLAHKIVFIVGDFTGVIGDTSDKDAERPMLDSKTIKENLKTYKKQVGKIIDISKADFKLNSSWLKKLNYVDIAEQANIFSINQFISRDNIRRRLDEGKRVSVREMIYPLMQGYDSVAVKSDVEIGGTDQKFNLLSGRDMQKHFGQEPQNIIMNPIIEGLDGRKMSSSWGNTVNFLDSANEMFGKIMSLQDVFVIKYFEILTRVPMEQVYKYPRPIGKWRKSKKY
jgi:tyrosyl-tRNA synthetase